MRPALEMRTTGRYATSRREKRVGRVLRVRPPRQAPEGPEPAIKERLYARHA